MDPIYPHGASTADAATHNPAAMDERPLLARNDAGPDRKHNACQLCDERSDG